MWPGDTKSSLCSEKPCSHVILVYLSHLFHPSKFQVTKKRTSWKNVGISLISSWVWFVVLMLCAKHPRFKSSLDPRARSKSHSSIYPLPTPTRCLASTSTMYKYQMSISKKVSSPDTTQRSMTSSKSKRLCLVTLENSQSTSMQLSQWKSKNLNTTLSSQTSCQSMKRTKTRQLWLWAKFKTLSWCQARLSLA